MTAHCVLCHILSCVKWFKVYPYCTSVSQELTVSLCSNTGTVLDEPLSLCLLLYIIPRKFSEWMTQAQWFEHSICVMYQYVISHLFYEAASSNLHIKKTRNCTANQTCIFTVLLPPLIWLQNNMYLTCLKFIVVAC